MSMLGGLLKQVAGALREVPGVIVEAYENRKRNTNSLIFRMKSGSGFLEE